MGVGGVSHQFLLSVNSWGWGGRRGYVKGESERRDIEWLPPTLHTYTSPFL